MELFHFLNLQSQKPLLDYIQNIQTFSNHWINPSAKLDRVVFSKISEAEQFLESFTQNENLIKKIGLPSIICSLDSAYELEHVLDLLNEQKNIKCEILCTDSPKMDEDIQYFLQDKLPEFKSKISPRFSLVHTNYEINLNTNLQKKRKKTSRKPPLHFQKLLKKFGTDLFPSIIGNEYYGNQVFNSIMSLILSQITNNGDLSDLSTIIPSSPMKFYDLQNKDEKSFEFRFQKYLSIKELKTWLESIRVGFDMLRLSYIYESWSTKLDFKSAGSDRFFFGFNDVEFAFAQKNFESLQYLANNLGSAALYFQLTRLISENDFRIELINNHFKLPIFTR
ncbi:hypothetical protein DSAG12_02852 [Promethearchaeum syntrophicum]|uniref:Uncharacterized protein n=1 Tax=Promethearchaeum syntrophicum TaxID=2594042 RepID=A0A5B9DE02_9ARCH|nr:hypothetical protein [Candidatus Prometheoarchaeum syntrophicum]QEE17020.1 hypothetical protein DSAG12_02852 [Candidatus Prometheoarchaeum syntrophicum]